MKTSGNVEYPHCLINCKHFTHSIHCTHFTHPSKRLCLLLVKTNREDAAAVVAVVVVPVCVGRVEVAVVRVVAAALLPRPNIELIRIW